MKDNPVFGKFKLGDKVWYPEATTPFRKRIPGIVEKDKIQTVGKRRDEYITSGVSPFIEFTDLDTSSIQRRRKEFPGEEGRIRLHHMGIEREYIDWKKKAISSSSKDEEDLLYSIKGEFKHGAYEKWYTDKGYSNETIRSLLDKGLIHKQRSSFRDNYILVPKGETYG